MAISAYRQGTGLLRKNALKGSSLDVDATREDEKRRYMSLHDRARKFTGSKDQFQAMIAREDEHRRKTGLQVLASMDKIAQQVNAEAQGYVDREFDTNQQIGEIDKQLGDMDKAGMHFIVANRNYGGFDSWRKRNADLYERGKSTYASLADTDRASYRANQRPDSQESKFSRLERDYFKKLNEFEGHISPTYSDDLVRSFSDPSKFTIKEQGSFKTATTPAINRRREQQVADRNASARGTAAVTSVLRDQLKLDKLALATDNLMNTFNKQEAQQRLNRVQNQIQAQRNLLATRAKFLSSFF